MVEHIFDHFGDQESGGNGDVLCGGGADQVEVDRGGASWIDTAGAQARSQFVDQWAQLDTAAFLDLGEVIAMDHRKRFDAPSDPGIRCLRFSAFRAATA